MNTDQSSGKMPSSAGVIHVMERKEKKVGARKASFCFFFIQDKAREGETEGAKNVSRQQSCE